MDLAAQRVQIQTEVDEYFGCSAEIGPRAMAALQGRWRREVFSEYEIPTESVFEGLLASSPACLLALLQAGIPVEELFWPVDEWNDWGLEEGPAPMKRATLDAIFRGNVKGRRSITRCPSARRIAATGKLTEAELLCCFLETAYRGPSEFSEAFSERMLDEYASDVGNLLLHSGLFDTEEVKERWDGNPGTYRVRSIAVGRLKELTDQIRGVDVADPSHQALQFALWLDPRNRLRLRPFGVGSLGAIEPDVLKDGQSFIFRAGIFQPTASVLPAFNEEVIAELEEMMNSRHCQERDFQRFFEQYPEFLLGLDYKMVHPQLVLYNEDRPGLSPDFMLEPMATEFCDLLELKLPYESLVARLRRQSRVRFRAVVNEAFAQLTEYRRYFESKGNRDAFHARYGLEAYYPRMILVIGRRHHFKSDAERKELRALQPRDLEIWTYDDLVARAKRYRECFTVP